MGDAEDFWPAIDDAEDPNSPVVVLRKQAHILTEKSGLRLRGRISTNTVSPGLFVRELLQLDMFASAFTHVFAIDVPSLDDYSFTLFAITHGMEPYPVAVEEDNHQWQTLRDVDVFTAWLKQTLSSDKTKRILKTLSEQAGR